MGAFITDLNELELCLIQNLYTDETMEGSLYGIVVQNPVFNILPRIHHHSVLSDAAKTLRRNKPVPDIETLSSPTAAATLNSSIEAEESDNDNSSILSVISSEGDAEIDAKFQQGLTQKRAFVYEDDNNQSRKKLSRNRESMMKHLPDPIVNIFAENTGTLQNVANALPLYVACLSIYLANNASNMKKFSILSSKDLAHPRFKQVKWLIETVEFGDSKVLYCFYSLIVFLKLDNINKNKFRQLHRNFVTRNGAVKCRPRRRRTRY